MSLKFKIIHHYEAEVDLSLLLLKECTAILQHDTSENKSAAKRVLKAVYLLADEDSPCDGMGEEDRWEFVLYNCDLTNEIVGDYETLLRDAVAAYVLVNTTSIKRAIDVLDKTIDATSRMLSATKPVIEEIQRRKKTGVDVEGNPEYETVTTFRSNAEQIREYSQELNDLIEQRERLYTEYVRKKAAGELRSGKEAGALASGKLRNPVLSDKFRR